MPVITLEVSQEVADRFDALPDADRQQLSEIAAQLSQLPKPQPAPKYPDAYSLASLREEAKARGRAFAALREQWASAPESPEEPTFEALQEGINENRRATGERLVY